MRILLLVCLVANICVPDLVIGESNSSQRIVGGNTVAIGQYPYAASLLHSWNLVIYRQLCGGAIITTTAVLSAAQCFVMPTKAPFADVPIKPAMNFYNHKPNSTFRNRGHTVNSWRVRVGSSLANNDGSVYALRTIVLHQQYNALTADNDIAVLRTDNLIAYETGRIAPASIAGGGYNVADNQPVWAVGWGAVSLGGPTSEDLRHVHLRAVNLDLCRLRYSELGLQVTGNMLCAGWLDEGGRGLCGQDAGGPLVHNGVLVGVLSWSQLCGLARYPSVSTRVSNYVAWIRSVAVG